MGEEAAPKGLDRPQHACSIGPETLGIAHLELRDREGRQLFLASLPDVVLLDMTSFPHAGRRLTMNVQAYVPALVSFPAVGPYGIMTPKIQTRWRHQEEFTDAPATQNAYPIR